MMLWLRWVFSPIGRWAAAVGAGLALLFTIYIKGRREGAAALRQEQDDERNRRSHAAIEADNAARRDAAAGRLLANDGHRRD